MGYRGKVAERERARDLRAQAWTLEQIAGELGVSKGSVSTWVRDVAFTPLPRQPSRRRAPNTLQRRKQTEIDDGQAWGRRQIGELSGRDLLIAGAALYAGGGSKRDGQVGFANTNARMMALFCRWLRECFDIDESRLRVKVYLHEGLDLRAAVAHWSAVTNIPLDQFRAPYRARADPSIRRSKHPMGCATVTYSCSRTHRQIIGLITAMMDGRDMSSGGGT